MRLTTTFLYMAQPAARLAGRLRHGLSPWRRRSRAPPEPAGPPHDRHLERALARPRRARAERRVGTAAQRRRDLLRRRVRALGPPRARRHAGLDAHADGRRGARRRPAARCASAPGRDSPASASASRSGSRALAVGAALSGAWVVAAVLAVVVAVIVICVVKDCATAAGVLTTVLEAEAREAQRELEPAAKDPEPQAGVNGHGPDGAHEHDGALDDQRNTRAAGARTWRSEHPCRCPNRVTCETATNENRRPAVPHHPEAVPLQAGEPPDG